MTVTTEKALFIGGFCGLVVGYAAGTLMWFQPTPRHVNLGPSITTTASSCTCREDGKTWPCLVSTESPFLCDHGGYSAWVKSQEMAR